MSGLSPSPTPTLQKNKKNKKTFCLLVTFESSAISFVLITLTIKGPPFCIIHDTAVPMSEIKWNKLEITSLRQCDSIKIQGNIGSCIIEGPARQDSCQACQACCNDWIWPVTFTQINSVKITGYIDFLFLFGRAWECAQICLCRVWERPVHSLPLHIIGIYSIRCTGVFVDFSLCNECGSTVNQESELILWKEVVPHLEFTFSQSGPGAEWI